MSPGFGSLAIFNAILVAATAAVLHRQPNATLGKIAVAGFGPKESAESEFCKFGKGDSHGRKGVGEQGSKGASRHKRGKLRGLEIGLRQED